MHTLSSFIKSLFTQNMTTVNMEIMFYYQSKIFLLKHFCELNLFLLVMSYRTRSSIVTHPVLPFELFVLKSEIAIRIWQESLK